MAEETWKNKEYVELIEKAFEKIDQAVNKKFKRPGKKGKYEILKLTEANRAKSALLAQPDSATFLPTLKKHINSDGGLLAHAIKTVETGILRNYQFVKGMEGHHWLHQNVMQWFKNIPVGRALQVMKRFRDEGGTSGVVWENLFPLSRRGHSAGNIEGDNKVVSAHLNPVSDKADTKMFSTFDRATDSLEEGKAFKAGQIFNKDDSIEYMVETIRNYAYDPGKRLTEIAGENPAEKGARKFISKLAGINLENVKDKSLLKKYKLILSSQEGWDLDINDLVKHIDQGGKLPDLDKLDMKVIDEGRGGLLKLLSELRSNPALSETAIKSRLKSLHKLKPGLKTGGKLPVLGKFAKGLELLLELGTGVSIASDLSQGKLTEFEKFRNEKYGGRRPTAELFQSTLEAGSVVTGVAAIPSGGISAIPSFALGGTAQLFDFYNRGQREKDRRVFTRFFKEDKYIRANTDLPEDDPMYGLAEIKQWDPEKERIERIKNLELNIM